MTISVIFEQRDFSGPLALGGFGLEVENMEWRALGGPWRAVVRARAASLAELWELAGLLRCGVTICDSQAACWWGYVSAVELRDGARRMRIGLEEMWNRVMVRYRDVSPGAAGGVEHFSTWVSDVDSIRNYGTKDIILDGGQATLASANGIAAARLAQRSQPLVTAWVEDKVEDKAAEELPAAGDTAPFAQIECRGWWETLGWQYYTQERGQVGSLHGGASYSFGTSGVQRVASGFASASGTWLVSEVWLRVKKHLSADSLTVQICANNAGVPGTVLASGSIASANLEDDLNWVRIEFNTPVSVGAGLLHLVLSRSGSFSASNYYDTSVDEGLRFASYSMQYYTGSAWLARTPDADLTFLLAGVEDTGTQAADTIRAGQFMDGCRLCSLSGISGRLYRDGSQRIREEAEQLLVVNGTLARVSRARFVEIYVKPAGDNPRYRIAEDGGLLRADGRMALPSDLPAGEWAHLGETAGVGALLGYAGAVWLEQVRWQAGRLRSLR